MRARSLLVVSLLVSVLLAGCAHPDDDGPREREGPPTWRAPVPASAGCVDPSTVPLERPQPVVSLETNMGSIDLEVFADLVPITAANFIGLVEDGFYDGTRFHRIITDFMMQGGDPNTRDGPGGNAATIPDEFHHRLRHDAPGILAMANAGPNTGSSQFYITFGPTPHLDDKHSVFGQVVGGMDVVEQVNAEVASQQGEPRSEVVLERATVTYPEAADEEEVSFGLWTPMSNPRLGTGPGETGVLVVATSCMAGLLPVTLGAEAPAGVTVRIEEDYEEFDLPGAQRVAVGATIAVESGAPRGPIPFTFILGSADGTETRLDLEVERDPEVGLLEVARGDDVDAHYLGVLVDGRMFDTSYAEVANDPDAARFASFADRPRGDTFTFAPGTGVIEGFTQLAVGAEEGTTSVGRIPPADAYGERGQHALAGRTLIFLLEIVAVDT